MRIFNINDEQDSLSVGMQDEIIRIASTRMGKSLSEELIAKVRQRKWSYRGLEMLMDTVRSIEIAELENYLSQLD